MKLVDAIVHLEEAVLHRIGRAVRIAQDAIGHLVCWLLIRRKQGVECGEVASLRCFN